ncbi:MAG TPA: hypothetical protein H9935_08485 [Candidatus Blautia merdigallinarum]|uniref:Uncharacterized protein n=1 Tax=Candidatus Blautia merdigallinarum TaxID=2838495 RepID=A0A9D2N6C0_9FIRM|nr:hypothetical protein [Candidatus Blautia merdigallinarum]
MKYSRWTHQDEAVRCFLEKEQGILEMATGTGKYQLCGATSISQWKGEILNFILG